MFKYFNNKNLGDYHDLYVQTDTLLLADIFENFRNKCVETYETDPAHFSSAPGVKLELSTDIDMLLMIEKGIRNGICHAIHRYAKVNDKYMKNYDNDIES